MQKPDFLSFEVRTFTDDEITLILDRSNNFRQLRINWRDSLLVQMREGWWEPANGDTIAFDTEGNLVNGQHRLSAAQLYQRERPDDPVWFVVVRNVPKKAEQQMDNVVARKLTDYIRREGVPHVDEVCQITLGHCMMQLTRAPNYSVLARGSAHYTVDGKTMNIRIPLPKAIDIFRRHRGKILQWSERGHRIQQARLPRGGMLASLGYQLSLKEQHRAIQFFETLIEGANTDGTALKKGDPIRVLRERFIKDRVARNNRMNKYTFLALAVKAWVAWNEGRTLDRLAWRGVGPNPEEFPSHEFHIPD